mmetsp:Transcript_15810/g.36690  ORF Transcript_15810/g.36690 Transcript_15810/m.36690 type:complete len:83 (+) Transcript_15810:4897-5145(+)
MPGNLENLPDAQAVQPDMPTTSVTNPAEQLVQVEAPLGLKVPAGQSRHAGMPTRGVWLPEVQEVQLFEARFAAKRPVAQFRQ